MNPQFLKDEPVDQPAAKFTEQMAIYAGQRLIGGGQRCHELAIAVQGVRVACMFARQFRQCQGEAQRGKTIAPAPGRVRRGLVAVEPVRSQVKLLHEPQVPLKAVDQTIQRRGRAASEVGAVCEAGSGRLFRRRRRA